MVSEKGKWVSPNEMLEKAKEMALEGRHPTTRKDWVIVMNFMACNVHEGLAYEACKLMAIIFEMPLTDKEVGQIVEFQIQKRKETKANGN